MRVGIFFFDEMEVLDFAGPFEIFTTASRIAGRKDPASATLFQVCTIAITPGLVHARGGLRVMAEYGIEDHPDLEILLIPGGFVDHVLGNADFIQWLTRQAEKVERLASICTGAFLLAEAGLLDGLKATTHWEDLDSFQQRYSRVNVIGRARWIDHGHLLTSAGISAGMDMSLHIVARLAGEELAEATAHQMEYSWNHESFRGG